MNIFVVILCLVMGRPYQFYYFVPLVTFWFLVLYVVLLVYPKVTAKLVEGIIARVDVFFDAWILRFPEVPSIFSQGNTASVNGCPSGPFLVLIKCYSTNCSATE